MFKESYDELKYNVTWPTWPSLYKSAITVIVASILVGLLIFLIDFAWAFIFNFLYS